MSRVLLVTEARDFRVTEEGKVLILDHVPDMLSLLEMVLSQMGYDTALLLMGLPSAVKEEAKRFDPDVILVDLLPFHGDDLALLDELQIDPSTRGVPVVALSTDLSLLDKAVASPNVKQVILKPFNLDDLERKVKAALERSAFIRLLRPRPVPLKPIYEEVVRGVLAESRALMIRWVQGISMTEPYRSHPVGFAGLIDHVPLLLEATLASLQVEDFRGLFKADPVLADRAADHARMRYQQGIPVSGVVLEYQFLRNEIWCAIAGVLMNKNVAVADMLDIVTRIDFVLDNILQITNEVYDQAAGNSQSLSAAS